MGDQPVLVDDEYLHTAWPRKYENTGNVTKNANGHCVNEGDGHRVSNEYAYVNRNTSADHPGEGDSSRNTYVDYPGEGDSSRNTYADVPLHSQISQVSDDHRTYLELINSGGHSARGPLPAPPGTTNAGFEGGKGKDERDKSSHGIFKTNRSVIIIVGAFAVLLLTLVIALTVGLRPRVRDVGDVNIELTTPVLPERICVRGPYGKQDNRSENDNFSDEELAANRTPSAFQFWTSENHIVALRVRYDNWGDIHGFWGDVPPNTAEFTSVVQILNPGEWVEDVYVGSDDDHEGEVPAGIYTVVQLQLVTNQRALPQVGYAAHDVEMASGQKLTFISGWSALAIDVIRFHFLSC